MTIWPPLYRAPGYRAPGSLACSGAGLEYVLTPAWSAKLEYRYTAAASLEASHITLRSNRNNADITVVDAEDAAISSFPPSARLR